MSRKEKIKKIPNPKYDGGWEYIIELILHNYSGIETTSRRMNLYESLKCSDNPKVRKWMKEFEHYFEEDGKMKPRGKITSWSKPDKKKRYV